MAAGRWSWLSKASKALASLSKRQVMKPQPKRAKASGSPLKVCSAKRCSRSVQSSSPYPPPSKPSAPAWAQAALSAPPLDKAIGAKAMGVVRPKAWVKRVCKCMARSQKGNGVWLLALGAGSSLRCARLASHTSTSTGKPSKAVLMKNAS